MPVVAVINRKGGSGKSTLATHLAVHYAQAGHAVLLGDVDRQQSAQSWLRRRVESPLPGTPTATSGSIAAGGVDPRSVLRVPAGISHVVLDTPGGLRGFDLARVVMAADVVLMPLGASVFDRESAADCHAELLALPRVASGRCRVAALGMRIDARTRGAEQLAAWAEGLKLEFVGVLRETQGYVRCIENGLTLFDLPPAQTQADRAQWQPLLEWLAAAAPAAPSTATAKSPARSPEVTAKATLTAAPRLATRPATLPETAPLRQRVPADVLEAAPRRGLAAFLAGLLGGWPLRRREARHS